MKRLPLLLLSVTLLCAAWGMPAMASTVSGAQASDQPLQSDGSLTGTVDVAESTPAPQAEAAIQEQAGQAAEHPLFQSFERKLEIIATTAAHGCAIMACDSHDDCQGNGSCYRCCYGVCMRD